MRGKSPALGNGALASDDQQLLIQPSDDRRSGSNPHTQWASAWLTEGGARGSPPRKDRIINKTDAYLCLQRVVHHPAQMVQPVPFELRRLLRLRRQHHFKLSPGHRQLDDDILEACRYALAADRDVEHPELVALNAAAGVMQGELGSGDGDVLVENPAFLLHVGAGVAP